MKWMAFSGGSDAARGRLWLRKMVKGKFCEVCENCEGLRMIMVWIDEFVVELWFDDV